MKAQLKNEMMKTHPTLDDAIALATKAHTGQKDKAGADYISHPLRVMELVEGDNTQIVAVLHDAIEDTDDNSPVNVTPEFLRDLGYSEEIIAAIEGVTKRAEEENDYESFILRAAKNPLSREVKLADLKDNMDLSRIASPTEKDLHRIRKYQRATQVLSGA